MNDIRDCERHCLKCKQWKHYSRFRSFRETDRNHGLGLHFAAKCRACEQIERNEKKNADRPLAIIKARARARATKLGVPFRFVWVNLNYRALVPVLRALMTPEGLCLDCGHSFVGERDIQIEHRAPPRHPQDWAREHTRNLALGCQSCNGTKGGQSFETWLDEQEDARLANEHHREQDQPGAIVPVQLTIDDIGGTE